MSRLTFAPDEPLSAESAMMSAPMPSPLGDTLAGLTVGWLSAPAPRAGVRSPGPLRMFNPFVAVVRIRRGDPGCRPAGASLPPHRLAQPDRDSLSTLIIATAVTGKVTTLARSCGFMVGLAAPDTTPTCSSTGSGPTAFRLLGIQIFWPFNRTSSTSRVSTSSRRLNGGCFGLKRSRSMPARRCGKP